MALSFNKLEREKVNFERDGVVESGTRGWRGACVSLRWMETDKFTGREASERRWPGTVPEGGSVRRR